MISRNLNRYNPAALLCVVAALALSACATTPQAQQRQMDKQSAIEAILTEASDVAEGERCIRPNDFRNIRILDDQHIVFEGRRDKLWLNTLNMRCPGLRKDSVLRIERFSTLSSLCRMDSFEVYDWFEFPWYRRWPWQWNRGPSCSLGEFQPVNEAQVQALENAIKAARGN